MDEKYSFDRISAGGLAEIVDEYPSSVAATLHELDRVRYETIPADIAARRQQNGVSRLTHLELTALVEWKLAHGTFRPTLKKLVASNGERSVEETTTAGFADSASPEGVKKSLSILTGLRGVGPATASLLLSANDPTQVPFFSDELYRWTHWQPGPKSGWDRPIKYTAKEYLSLFARVQELQARVCAESKCRTSAIDIEKAAYVLGRRPLSRDNNAPSKASGKAKKRKAEANKEGDNAPPPRALGEDQSSTRRSSKRLMRSK